MAGLAEVGRSWRSQPGPKFDARGLPGTAIYVESTTYRIVDRLALPNPDLLSGWRWKVDIIVERCAGLDVVKEEASPSPLGVSPATGACRGRPNLFWGQAQSRPWMPS